MGMIFLGRALFGINLWPGTAVAKYQQYISRQEILKIVFVLSACYFLGAHSFEIICCPERCCEISVPFATRFLEIVLGFRGIIFFGRALFESNLWPSVLFAPRVFTLFASLDQIAASE